MLKILLIFQQLCVEGFNVTRWAGPKWVESVKEMAKWISEGKIKAKETVVDGFERTPEAFMGLFTGDNTGKMVVKC